MHPHNVYIGICQQNKDDTENCLDEEISSKYKDNIRILRLSYKEARGPTYARYLCAQLFDNQDFFLQIDSHNLFTQDWDKKCIDMMTSLEQNDPSKKYVLSHYPPTYDEQTSDSDGKHVTHISKCFFNDDGLISFHGAVYKEPKPLPQRNAFVAAGFIFARGEMVMEVPFDPYLPYLFAGEEILLSIRLFTHGYDVYTPNRNIVFHAYTRSDEPKFWDDHRLDSRDAIEKVKYIMGIHQDLMLIHDKTIRDSIVEYGLGTERTAQEFFRFIGVDLVNKTIDPTIEFFSTNDNMNLRITEQLLFLLLILLCLFRFLRVHP